MEAYKDKMQRIFRIMQLQRVHWSREYSENTDLVFIVNRYLP